MIASSFGCIVGAEILKDGRPSWMFYILPLGIIACSLQLSDDFKNFAGGHCLKALIFGITYTMVPTILIEVVPDDIHSRYVAQPVTLAYQAFQLITQQLIAYLEHT